MSSIPESLLEGLNTAQREAVLVKDGPLLVLAGPGSGKTRVVTHRIAALLHQGVYPSQIVALTFTNKAADVMKQRIADLTEGQQVWIGTFHKFCAYLLRRYIQYAGLNECFTIYDTDESFALIKNIVSKQSTPSAISPQKIQHTISWTKNQLTLPEEYEPNSGSQIGRVVKEIYPLYQDELRRANAVDFDDLLLHSAVLLRDNPEIRQTLDNRYRYVLVDEYQDTNSVQYVIAKALSLDHRNLAVTGDPDQSIYGWRGADINNILNFEKDYPDAKVIRLEQNYRSTPQILAAADALISHNQYRKDKKLFTQNSNFVPVRVTKYSDQQSEAENIAAEVAEEIHSGKRKASDYAVFYRMNALSRNLELAMRKLRVPYQLVRGLEFFQRKEIKDVLSYLRLLFNPADTVAFQRVVNEPPRGIGKTTVQKLTAKAEELGIATLEVARSIPLPLTAKTKKTLQQFVAMLDKLAVMSAEDYPIASLIETILQDSGLRKMYADSADEADLERWENIQELVMVAREFDELPLPQTHTDLLLRSPLEEFLEQCALVSDVDALDNDTERVSLMTLHAAKGLEFPVVYIIALEEGILPHERSSDDVYQLEEERRLFFVGITRAEQELRISRVERRSIRGMYGTSVIYSRFLYEIPNHLTAMPAVCADNDDKYDGIDLVYDEDPPIRCTKPAREYSIMTAAELLAAKMK